MAELQFTFAGQAVPFQNPDTSPQTPFTASFDVDTSSGMQAVQFFNGTVTGFQSADTHFTNVQVTVGGNSVLSVPATNGELWGMSAITPGQLTFDSGVAMPAATPAFSLEWLLGAPSIPQGTPDPISAILLGGTFVGRVGEVGGLWDLEQYSVQVRDISASVPEPGMIGLFSLAVVALICARRGRRRKLSLQP